MARIATDPNYSSPTFPRATAGTDLFLKEDVQSLAAAMSTHVHDGAGKGLQVTSIPASAIANGSVTLAKLAADSVDSSKIVDGTIATADIAANAISQVVTATSVAADSTTSASMVALVAPTVSITTTGGIVLAWFTGPFASTLAAGAGVCFFGLRVDSGAYTTLVALHSPGAGSVFPVAQLFSFGALAAGAHTINVGWSTGSGTLSANTAASRYLLVVELKR